MKRLFTLLTMLMAFSFVAPAYAEFRDMWAYVYTWDGKEGYHGEKVLTRKSTNITFQVLQADSDTIETIYVYADNAFTSITNPVTTTSYASNTICNDQVRFRVDPGETNDVSVDLIVTDVDGGYTAFVENFNAQNHTIIIDERPGILHNGIIWYGSGVSATEVDTGIDFDYDTLIYNVLVEPVTVDATETIEVGLLSSETAGDADGFRDIVAISTAGFPTDTGIITGGSNIDYTPISTYGVLLATTITGSDAVATNGGRSFIDHVITGANAKSLTYTTTAGTDTGVGYIHYQFMRLR